jgi:demethylmenaquinone methyltransferase/2-methoxy-6-polyprenyl-1,4-benzoquinol methylase
MKEQISYYRARAPEYDEWFFRKGRYDRGEAVNKQWFAEIEVLRRALMMFKPEGHVLELACGTGLWTEQLIKYCDRITAVDAAPEALSINRGQLQSPKVNYIQENIFTWQPRKRYDTVFFGFWLSHVPPERFDAFWKLVGNAMKPAGRVFFVDSCYDPTSTARDHYLEGDQATTMTRRLNDGRTFRIVKVFYDINELSHHLGGLGWAFDMDKTANFFIYGSGSKIDTNH